MRQTAPQLAVHAFGPLSGEDHISESCVEKRSSTYLPAPARHGATLVMRTMNQRKMG
jgi:hypothetical protein